MGLLSTLMSIGGGVFITALMTFYGHTIQRAVATSSAFGPIIAIPGALGFIWAGWHAAGLPPGSLGYVSLLGALLIIPTSVLAAPLGVRLAHGISRRKLELAFATFLAVVGVAFSAQPDRLMAHDVRHCGRWPLHRRAGTSVSLHGTTLHELLTISWIGLTLVSCFAEACSTWEGAWRWGRLATASAAWSLLWLTVAAPAWGQSDDWAEVSRAGLRAADEGRFRRGRAAVSRCPAAERAVRPRTIARRATSLNNLAYILHAQGHYLAAEPHYREALAMREAALGKDHADVAQSCNNLAELYRVLGRYAEAEPLHQRALAIREKAVRARASGGGADAQQPRGAVRQPGALRGG